MNILNKIKDFVGLEKSFDKDTFRPIQSMFTQRWYWKDDPRSLSDRDYLKMSITYPWAYNCIEKITGTISKLDYHTVKNWEEVNHPYNKLIDQDLLEKIVWSLLSTGDAFLYVEKMWNSIDEIHFLPTPYVRIESNSRWNIKWYEYNVWSNSKVRYEKDEIVHIKKSSPYDGYLNPQKGISPLRALWLDIRMDEETSLWNYNFFKNGAMPGFIWKVTDDINPDSPKWQPLDKDQIEKIKKRINQLYKGSNNSFKTMILNKGLELDQINTPNEKEFGFIESRKQIRDNVIGTFWIPKVLLWLSQDVNRATAQQEVISYYEDTIKSWTRKIEDKLNEKIFSNDWVAFEFINVVPSDKELLIKLWNAWIITRNEAREKMTYDAMEDGDVVNSNWNLASISLVQDEKGLNKNSEEDDKLTRQVESSLKKNTIGTQEWKENIRYKAVDRMEDNETEVIEQLEYLYENLESKVFSQINWQWEAPYLTPEIEYEDVLEKVESNVKPLFNDVLLSESNAAFDILWLERSYKRKEVSTALEAYLLNRTRKLASSIKDTLNGDIKDLIKEANEEWYSIDRISDLIQEKFGIYKSVNARRIARTEVSRYTNRGALITYEKSWVVEEKEWLAELDWRTSEICQKLNWKRFKLDETVAKEGDIVGWYEVWYWDIIHPPAHPNCRSTLIPVITEKSMKMIKNINKNTLKK